MLATDPGFTAPITSRQLHGLQALVTLNWVVKKKVKQVKKAGGHHAEQTI